jgi:GntR family transcriptional repressor for pyruvate dehydrogenase complex
MGSREAGKKGLRADAATPAARCGATALGYRPVSRKEPLRDQVVEQITDSIRAGRFALGERLPTERELGVQFGVSRSVIRDALRLLEASGVVGIQHGRGIFVADHVGGHLGNRLVGPLIGLSDLRHLFELRMAVEVAGAGLAALHASPEEREGLLSGATSSLAIADDRLDDFARADERFHLLVHQSTHNPVFLQVMENLLDLLSQSRRASLRVPGRPHLSMTEHVRVAQRVAAGDPDGARAAMAWHLLSVEEAIAMPKEDARGS